MDDGDMMRAEARARELVRQKNAAEREQQQREEAQAQQSD